jgi:hypothetical protein
MYLHHVPVGLIYSEVENNLLMLKRDQLSVDHTVGPKKIGY